MKPGSATPGTAAVTSVAVCTPDEADAIPDGREDVLDTAQNLYERHQLITYPRSDSRYLPEEHFSQREAVIRAIARVAPDLSGFCEKTGTERRSAAWNDQKWMPTTQSFPQCGPHQTASCLRANRKSTI